MIAVIGNGHVGKAMRELFPQAAVYDKHQPDHANRAAVQGASLALVCVPTPSNRDGSADTSAVEEVCEWLDAELICIKSAVPPGTTALLAAKYQKRITVSPEYEGETPWQRGARDWPYVIVGGFRKDANDVLAFFQKALGPEKSYWATSWQTAELVKYMENSWLALQVTFANEFYEIARSLGADYNAARELWALDPRISATHTLVFQDDRGYGGRCLPKDTAAIVAASEKAGYEPTLLKAMQEANERFRG